MFKLWKSGTKKVLKDQFKKQLTNYQKLSQYIKMREEIEIVEIFNKVKESEDLDVEKKGHL